jgi:hypothetical protein
MPNRVLIIANAVLADPAQLPAPLTAATDPPQDVLVVAPLLTTALQTLCSDIDAARRDAAKRLGYITFDLKSLGMSPRGALGDENQELTVDDALARFSADWCVVLNRLSRCQTRAEQHSGRRICARSGLPTVELTADGSGRLCSAPVHWQPDSAAGARCTNPSAESGSRPSRNDGLTAWRATTPSW